MQSQLEHERDISRRITRVATRYKTESRRASVSLRRRTPAPSPTFTHRPSPQHEALSLTEELEATRQDLEIDRERFEAAEDNLERVEEQLNAERARTENFEQQLREERERLVSTRERLHLQHEAHLEEKAGLVDQLRSMSVGSTRSLPRSPILAHRLHHSSGPDRSPRARTSAVP